MKKFIGACLVLLSLVLFSVNVSAMDVKVIWETPQEGTAGYYVYYDTDGALPLDGTGATQGDSPVQVTDLEARELILTGLASNEVYYAAVSAYNSEMDEGPLSSIKRYRVIKSFVPNQIETTTYTEGDYVNFYLNFGTNTQLINGDLILILNSGAYLIVPPESISWDSQVAVQYLVQAGESASPLIVSDAYLDPNDLDVSLYDDLGTVCPDIAGPNLNSDPNNLINIIVTPGPPSGVSTCCED